MFPNRKNKLMSPGDFVSENEALMDRDSEIQFRCEVLDEVVKDRILSFSDALEAYEVTPEQYIGYLMMKGTDQKVIVTKSMIVAIVKTLLEIMDLSHTKLDTKTKSILDQMRHFSGVK